MIIIYLFIYLFIYFYTLGIAGEGFEKKKIEKK